MPRAPLEGLNLLVVEDVVDNQDLFRVFLETAGARIDIVDNGIAALAKTTSDFKYDLVLMDIQMPGLDGLSATRQMRAAGVTVPIIALTAHAMPEEVLKSKEAGCNDHVAKPVTSQNLIAAILRATNSGYSS